MGRLLAVGYAIAFLAFTAIGFSSYAQIGTLQEELRRVEHTRQVLGRIGTVSELVKDADRAQRGYLITGRDLYLDPYHQAVGQVDAELGTLLRMTADNPASRRSWAGSGRRPRRSSTSWPRRSASGGTRASRPCRPPSAPTPPGRPCSSSRNC
nr:hypothetical protein GCM10020093_107190 [Planobispora longispora]